LALEGGEATINELLERIGPHNGTVNHGTIWTVLERARENGLVSYSSTDETGKRPRGRPSFWYGLTDGGRRRVKWIKGALKRKEKPELRAVANPGKDEEE
jgi:DNA-binding PadR family transcriptional regulator